MAALILLQGNQFRRLILVATITGLLGVGAFGIATAATPHTGSIPVSGPTGSGNGGGGGFGGDSGQADSALVTLLQATTTEWAAATDGSMSSAPLALASGKSVMAIGGFNGGDPAPTLARFQQYVAEGKIGYYVSGGRGGGGSAAAPATSPPGSPPTTRPRRSAAPRCTTCGPAPEQCVNSVHSGHREPLDSQAGDRSVNNRRFPADP